MNERVYNLSMLTHNKKHDYQGVDGERIATRLAELAGIGEDSRGGTTRFGFSPEEKAAKNLAKEWMEEAGMEVTIDGAGNVIGKLKGKNEGPAFASGSHLDTVPNGGDFDGTVGVVTAIEVAQAWKDSGEQPERDYHTIVFSEEEGSRFGTGLIGSSAFMGILTANELNRLHGFDGMSFEKAMAEYGTTLDKVFKSKREDEYELYIETHIEQGEELEAKKQPVGIVRGISGVSHLRIEFKGVSDHAGATPMNRRKDPLVAAGKFFNELPGLPGQISDTAVATVGKVNVLPNGANVIPESVEFFVDIRDIDNGNLAMLIAKIRTRAAAIAKEYDLEIIEEQQFRASATIIDEKWQEKLAEVMEENDIKPVYLPSGAGHDAMVLAEEIPVAMQFIQSKGGINQ